MTCCVGIHKSNTLALLSSWFLFALRRLVKGRRGVGSGGGGGSFACSFSAHLPQKTVLMSLFCCVVFCCVYVYFQPKKITNATRYCALSVDIYMYPVLYR